MDAIILAGGLGTRLSSILPGIPKPLAPIRGTAFLDLLLEQLKRLNVVERVILAVGYKAEQIRAHYETVVAPLPLLFSVETAPLGTGGALKQALALAESSTVLALNGDSYLACDLGALLEQHRAKEALFTIACLHVADASRYGQIAFDSATQVITAFLEKSRESAPGWINGGIYVLQRELFEAFALGAAFSLEIELFPQIAAQRKLYAAPSNGLFIDIGTPESLEEAQHLLASL